MLATLEDSLGRITANGALELQKNLLGGLDLLVKNGLGLTSETGLLHVITTLTLSGERGLTGLLLPGDSVKVMLIAFFAVSFLLLGEVDHD